MLWIQPGAKSDGSGESSVVIPSADTVTFTQTPDTYWSWHHYFYSGSSDVVTLTSSEYSAGTTGKYTYTGIVPIYVGSKEGSKRGGTVCLQLSNGVMLYGDFKIDDNGRSSHHIEVSVSTKKPVSTWLGDLSSISAQILRIIRIEGYATGSIATDTDAPIIITCHQVK
jgi:hypothetical protein